MDLDELLSFNPQQKLGKHSRDEAEASSGNKAGKKEDNGLSDQEKLLLLQRMEDDDEEVGKRFSIKFSMGLFPLFSLREPQIKSRQ